MKSIREIAISHQRQMGSVHPHAIIGTIEEAIEEYIRERAREECTIPVVSGSLPLASEIEAKKNELFPIDENPNTDWRMNHNDNMERYRRGFDSAIEWIVSRASESNDR